MLKSGPNFRAIASSDSHPERSEGSLSTCKSKGISFGWAQDKLSAKNASDGHVFCEVSIWNQIDLLLIRLKYYAIILVQILRVVRDVEVILVLKVPKSCRSSLKPSAPSASLR